MVTADHAVSNLALEFMPDSFAGNELSLMKPHHERAIASGIASGATEIQLNIVAQSYLELPREPRA